MYELKLSIEAGMSTSEADLLAGVAIMVLEANDPGVVRRLTSVSFNPNTAAEEHYYYPPTSMSGILYTSCTGDTQVVMSDSDCEVWVYAGGKAPVAVLRNDNLEILDYNGWDQVWVRKRESLEGYAVNISYPQEWYLIEDDFDSQIMNLRKKKSKTELYPEDQQDRFRHCIPVRNVDTPVFKSHKEFLKWLYGQCYVHDVKKPRERVDRKSLKKARREKSKQLSIKRRSTRKAQLALR